MKEIGVISDFELAKLMMDPKRSRILAAAADEPVTVKQIADKVGEIPSRLYYHVKKLEEAGFLTAVETKQQGNLIERYYRTSVERQSTFKLDERMASEHSGFIVQWMNNLVQSGLTVLEKSLEMGENGHTALHADASVIYSKLTHAEWLARQQKVADVIGSQKEKLASDAAKQGGATDSSLAADTVNDADKDDYVFILMTYRLSDAERLLNKNENDSE